jgi:phosphoribosylformylglycinamidine synthase
VRTETTDSPFTNELKQGTVLRLPIAHAEGNYVCDDATLAELQNENRIVFRYCDPNGNITPEANPNGARDNIAGICSRGRNVLGLMPHPNALVKTYLVRAMAATSSDRLQQLSPQLWFDRQLLII